MSTLTEILFSLFARLRPVLWYYLRLRDLIGGAIRVFADPQTRFRLWASPSSRRMVEGILADAEHCLDIIIGLRAAEILGRPVHSHERPGLRRAWRIHHATSFAHLERRLLRLIERYGDVERLARLRASRLQRDMDGAVPLASLAGAGVSLVVYRAPAGALMLLAIDSYAPVPGCVAPAPAPDGRHIRAPPRQARRLQLAPLQTCSPCLRGRDPMPRCLPPVAPAATRRPFSVASPNRIS